MWDDKRSIKDASVCLKKNGQANERMCSEWDRQTNPLTPVAPFIHTVYRVQNQVYGMDK